MGAGANPRRSDPEYECRCAQRVSTPEEEHGAQEHGRAGDRDQAELRVDLGVSSHGARRSSAVSNARQSTASDGMLVTATVRAANNAMA